MKVIRVTVKQQRELGLKVIKGRAISVQPRGTMYSPRGTAVSPIS